MKFATLRISKNVIQRISFSSQKTSIKGHEENDRDSVSKEEFVYFLVVKALFAVVVILYFVV